MSLRELLLVATGGALGSALRYLVTGVTQRWYAGGTTHWPLAGILAGLPFGTFVVNVTGSLLIGFAAGLTESRTLLGPEVRLLLVTGVLGGYTTFSAFSLESLVLIREGQGASAVLSISLQVLLGLAAAWAGFMAGVAAGRPV